MILELQVIKLKIKKYLKEYTKSFKLPGSVSGNMMDLPSVGDAHMKIGLCFQMSHIPDKIKGHDTDTIV